MQYLSEGDFLYPVPQFCINFDFMYKLTEAKLYYRAIKTKEISKDDFIPIAILNPKRLKTAKNNNDICHFYGISLYSDIEKLKQRISKYPRLGKYIAKCTIDENTGLATQENSDTHIELYPYNTFIPEKEFELAQ